jgi:membrane protein involved in colicin uptake
MERERQEREAEERKAREAEEARLAEERRKLEAERAEIARQRAEAEAKEQARIKAEREAEEKRQAEERAAREKAEHEARMAELEARRKAALPDAEKLLGWATELRDLPSPAITTKAAEAVSAQISAHLQKAWQLAVDFAKECKQS